MKFMKSLRMATKLKDQEGVVNVLGTVILLLSGLILYVDKLVDYFDIQVDGIHYYQSLDVFLWTVSGTIAPLLICLGYMLKGEKWALAAPVVAYSAQLTYIFRDVKWIGRDYFWLYTALFVIGFLVLAYFIKNYANTISTLKSKIRFLMDLIIIEIPKSVNDIEVYNIEIIEPALDKLDE